LYAQAGCGAAIKKSSHIAERKAAKTEAAKVPRSYVGSVKAAPSESSPWALLALHLVQIDLLTQINVAAKKQGRLCCVADKINLDQTGRHCGTPRARWTEGHGTDPKEQNTQQSPGFAFRRAPHPLQS